jgi:hypothetical protein
MGKIMLTQEILKELLHYDPDTGIFTWKITKSFRSQVGTIAGGHDNYGYLQISINYKLYKAHRLAWLWAYGAWPKDQIDHINCIKNDNRIINLRESNNIENKQNLKKCHKDNKSSGLLGVSFHKPMKKFESVIMVNGKKIRLGYFYDKHEAHEAYIKAKRELHPFGIL